MATRLTTEHVFPLGAFRNEQNVLALDAVYQPLHSFNFYMRKSGSLRMINGLSALNTAITTDTTADATRVTGLYAYKALNSDGTITRRIVAMVDDGANEREIWHSTDDGATFTFLKDLGTGGTNVIPDFAQFENTLIITTAYETGAAGTPQSYDGTSVADAGQTQPSAPTVAASSSAGELNGTYKYKVAIIDTSGSVGPASAASSSVTVEDLRIDLSSIPVESGGAGAADGRRIYRTLGDGAVYFRLADIDDNTTNTFEDNVSDFELLKGAAEPENIGDPPADGLKLCEPHRSRVFYANTDANPNRLYFGDVGNADAVGVDNYLRIGEGEDGDQITCLVGEFGGELVIFKEHSIWRLAGDGRNTFILIRTEAQQGAVGKQAVARVPAGAVWTDAYGQGHVIGRPSLVYIAPDNTIRVFDGIGDTIISRPVEVVTRAIQYSARQIAFAAPYRPYNWIVFGIPESSGTVAGYVAWDYVHGTWHRVDFWPEGYAAAVGDTSSENHVFYLGAGDITGTGGVVHQCFTGTSNDGSNITAYIVTKGLDLGVPNQRKMFQYLWPYVEALGSALNLTVNVKDGWADATKSSFSTHTFSMQESDVDMVDPEPIVLKDSNGDFLLGKAVTFEFTVTGQTVWELRGFIHGARVLPVTLVAVA